MLSLRWNELRSLYLALIVGCTRVVEVAVVGSASELASHPFIFSSFFFASAICYEHLCCTERELLLCQEKMREERERKRKRACVS